MNHVFGQYLMYGNPNKSFPNSFLWQQVGFSGKELYVYYINKIAIENLTKTYHECEKS